MSVLCKQNNEATIIIENADTSLNCGAGVRERIAAPAVQDRCTRPQIRMGKVLAVRQQLIEGTYDLEERLKIALDRLLENLVA